MDRFTASLHSDASVPAEAARLIEKTWADCPDCDPAEFLTQGLALLSPPLRQGLDAYDTDRYAQCADVMQGLHADANPFIAIHAAVYEIKALVAMDRLLEAGKRIEALLRTRADDVAAYSYFAPEVSFLRGVCLLGDLDYEAAIVALSEFLEEYPDGPAHLVITAQQMLAELEKRRPGQIGEVVDLMSFAGRRLSALDSGDIVRTRQQRIIDILDALIEEAEQQEQSSSSSGSQSSQGGSKGSSTPQNSAQPMQQSQLPGGAATEPTLRSTRRANPGDVWGSMPPAERERILQALHDSFPSRYRRLVEQYYEELAKKP